MGVDAYIYKHKISNISKKDRARYLKWSSKYVKENDLNWSDFIENVFYVYNRCTNRIIMDSILETTSDTFCEDGASLLNKDTLNLVISKAEKAINDGCYKGYQLTDSYQRDLNELVELFEKEKNDLESNIYTYLYHVTY